MTIKVHHTLLMTGAAGGLGTAMRDRLKANCEVLRLSDRSDFGAARDGEEVVLADLAARVLADHAPAAFEGGRELALQDDAPGQQLSAHPLMLELALRNLVDNALRHTPPGTQVLVRTWQTPGEFGIDVLDDGGGPAHAPTHAPAPADKGSNLGIGLTLVRRIASEHGAELQAAPLRCR